MGRSRGGPEQSIELAELHLCTIAMSKSRCPFHLADDRIKRAVGMLGRAEIAQARVRFAFEALHERSSKPRFTDTRFPREQHHLAFRSLCL